MDYGYLGIVALIIAYMFWERYNSRKEVELFVRSQKAATLEELDGVDKVSEMDTLLKGASEDLQAEVRRKLELREQQNKPFPRFAASFIKECERILNDRNSKKIS